MNWRIALVVALIGYRLPLLGLPGSRFESRASAAETLGELGDQAEYP